MPTQDTAKRPEDARARDAQLRWQAINRQKREREQEQLRFAQDVDAPSLSPDRVSPYSALNSPPDLTSARARDTQMRWRALNRPEVQLGSLQDVDGPPLDYFERPIDRELMRAVGDHGSGGELSQDERDRSSEAQRNAYSALAFSRRWRQPRGLPENEWLMEYGPNSTFDRNPDAGLVPQARENAARTLSEIRLTPEQQLYNTIFGSTEAHAQMSREEANDKGAVYKVLLDAQERHRASVAQMDAEELNDLLAENALLSAEKENAELKRVSDPNSLEAKEEYNAERVRALAAHLDDPVTVQPGMESFTSAGNSLLFDEQEGRDRFDAGKIGASAAAGAAFGSFAPVGGTILGGALGGAAGLVAGIAGTGNEDVDTVAEAREWLRDDLNLQESGVNAAIGRLHDLGTPWEDAVNYLNIQAGAAGDANVITPGIVQAMIGRWKPVFYDRDRSIRQYMKEPEPVRQLPFGFSR